MTATHLERLFCTTGYTSHILCMMVLQFWQDYSSNLRVWTKINTLLCFSSYAFLYIFSNVLSTCVTTCQYKHLLETSCIKERWDWASLLQNWWCGSVLAAPVSEFYRVRAVCFKMDLEIVSVNTVKEKQILIKMKENCFSWESVVFLVFFSAKISTAWFHLSELLLVISWRICPLLFLV